MNKNRGTYNGAFLQCIFRSSLSVVVGIKSCFACSLVMSSSLFLEVPFSAEPSTEFMTDLSQSSNGAIKTLFFALSPIRMKHLNRRRLYSHTALWIVNDSSHKPADCQSSTFLAIPTVISCIESRQRGSKKVKFNPTESIGYHENHALSSAAKSIAATLSKWSLLPPQPS